MTDDGEAPPITPPKTERWRELAEKASKEEDPKKLLEEIEDLCAELEQREAARKRPRA